MIRRPGTSIALKQSDVDDLARVLTERRRIARPPGADLADESRNAGVGIAAAQQANASAADESSAVEMDQSSMQSDVDMLVEAERRRRQERDTMTREQRIGV